MSFVQNFSITQSTDVTSFTITDTSTGSDSNITNRQIFLQKSDGTYLVPTGTSTNYIPFPLTSSYILLSKILNVDYCLNITVNWLDINGNVLYTKNGLYLFTGNSELFYYTLTTQQAANPNKVDDVDWYSNKLQLRTEIDSANSAVNYSDQANAQAALNRAYYMISNQNIFF